MEKRKATMTVIRKSNGEEVDLKLHQVCRRGLIVVIDIPGYNARLTFTAAGKWVKLVGRERINPVQEDATLHVSKSVWNRDFKGVTIWADAILHAKREGRQTEPQSPASAPKPAWQWWAILWQATFADFPQMLIRAVSKKEALQKARRVPDIGAFTVISDQLYAIQLGCDKEAAKQEYQRLKYEADQAQKRGLALPLISDDERAEVLQQLAGLKASLLERRVGISV